MPSPLSAKFARGVAWVVLAVCAGFVLWHACATDRYLTRVSAISFQNAAAGGAGEDRRDVTLGVAADGQTWVRLTEERMARGELRNRWTDTDNAPEGRAVHWSSWWSLWLEGGGRVRAAVTGEDAGEAVAKAARWANLPLWALVLFGGGAWVARRWGAWGAAVFAMMLVGNRGFYTALYPAYPDHHGLVALLALGMILGVAGMGWGLCGKKGGGGRGKPADETAARRAAVFSAMCGACGLALSASSLVVPIALVGVGGVVAIWLAGRDAVEDAAREASGLGVLWGRVGAGVALLLYVLEYAPGDFSWRLEVNHPAYALAWWGGAEVVAWVARVRMGRTLPAWHARAVLGAAGALLPLVLVGVAGAAVFAPADVFLAGVHRHIDELKPVWTQTGRLQLLFWAPLLLPLVGAALVWRGLEPRGRTRLAGLAVVVAGTGLLALIQHRWWVVAAAAQIPLAVVVASSMARETVWRGVRVAWVIAVAAMVLPGPWFLARERVAVEKIADVQKGEAMQLLNRDLAATLRAAAPSGEIVLLAFPNTSVAVGYYGGARTVGTLYWENGDGLRAAAEALTTADDGVAERVIRERGVTHVAVVSPGDFTAEYADALGISAEAVAGSLARRALEGRELPVWLRAVPYRVPPQFGRLQARVALYAVDWEIARAESRWTLGMARLMAGDEANGRAALKEAAEAGRWEAGLILAWRMATADRAAWRDGAGAVEWAEAAIARLPESAANRRVLAAAYAAAGRWPDAQATALFAIDQAKDAGDARLEAEIEAEFARYRERRALAE
jgi:hypothetical protein